MLWCETEGVDYVFGLAQTMIATAMEAVRQRRQARMPWPVQDVGDQMPTRERR